MVIPLILLNLESVENVNCSTVNSFHNLQKKEKEELILEDHVTMIIHVFIYRALVVGVSPILE